MAALPLDDFLTQLWRYWLVARASAEAIQEKRNLRFGNS
jgi:hypothetical protein